MMIHLLVMYCLVRSYDTDLIAPVCSNSILAKFADC